MLRDKDETLRQQSVAIRNMADQAWGMAEMGSLDLRPLVEAVLLLADTLRIVGSDLTGGNRDRVWPRA